MSRPRPVLALCSISALDRPLAAAATLAAAHGLDGLEVTARAPHLDPSAPDESIREAGRAVREAGVAVVAYGSYLGQAAPGGGRPASFGAAAAAREAHVAALLGAPLLRVWADCVAGAPDAGFAEVVATLQAACDAAAGAGVSVVVERHLGSFADTPERIAALFGAVARPNLALNYQVLDLLPQRLAAAQPDDARRLVPLARYFHLKNTRPAADGAGPMPPGGSLAGGVLDYRAILAAAFDAGYGGPLTIEFLSFEPRPIEEKLAADVAWLRGVLAELDRTGPPDRVSPPDPRT
jgi:sugar phosphate isomerase/epimerase